MFQTHSFEAFNPLSHVNLKCSLKFHPSNSSLSSLTIDYFFGITEKYQLTIPETSLSYDIAFVLGNLKGFYDYLHSLHQESKFDFCKFEKDNLTVSFKLKVFNQERTIQQSFKSTQISDEVIWKSQLKSKLENITSTLNSRMDVEVDRKVRHSMIEERQKNFMKSEAFEEKVNREISILKSKIEQVVNFINSHESTKKKLQLKDIRFRGRYGSNHMSIVDDDSDAEEDQEERKSARNYNSVIKIKPIQKEEKPPRRGNQNKSNRFSKELKRIMGIAKMNSSKPNRYLRPSAAEKIQEWEKQYKTLNLPDKIQVIPDQKPANKNANLVDSVIQKRSRGRPVVRSKLPSSSPRPEQQPFIIEKKFDKSNQIPEIQEVHKITSESNTNFSQPNLSIRKKPEESKSESENQKKARNDLKRDSKQKQTETATFNRGEQVSRLLQQALKRFDPTTKTKADNNLSARKPSVSKQDMIDENEQKKDKKSHEKSKQSFEEKLASEKEKHEKRMFFRRQIFQKNAKTYETIDLEEDDEESKRNSFELKSTNFFNSKIFEKSNDQVVKIEEGETKNRKKQNSQTSRFSSGHSNSALTKEIASRIASQISDKLFEVQNLEESFQNVDSQSDRQINRLDKIVENFKKQKRDEGLKNRIRFSSEFSEVQIIDRKNEQKERKQSKDSGEEISSVKVHSILTPNSKASYESLHQMVDPQKQPDFSNITPAKVPSFAYLNGVQHFVPDFTPNTKIKLHNAKIENYFTFERKRNQIITKSSKYSNRGKKEYIPLISYDSLPRFGKHFWAIRIVWSGNYHICMGIVDMPSEIKLGEIPKNCDALYVLDGGLHDEKGGNKKQNGWRPKDGAPVDVLQMELWMDKGEMYVIMVVDMDKEEMFFYYNENFICRTEFSTWCKKNKKRLHPYLALKTEKDCIEVV